MFIFGALALALGLADFRDTTIGKDLWMLCKPVP